MQDTVTDITSYARMDFDNLCDAIRGYGEKDGLHLILQDTLPEDTAKYNWDAHMEAFETNSAFHHYIKSASITDWCDWYNTANLKQSLDSVLESAKEVVYGSDYNALIAADNLQSKLLRRALQHHVI